MGLFARRREAYDRSRILTEASRARGRGRLRRAIRLYRWVLAAEPRNPDLHAKLAPLLARTGRRFDAWVHFRAAARGYQRAGSPDRVGAVHLEAVRSLPREAEAWLQLARFQRGQGRTEDAVRTLLEGRGRQRGRRARAQAIHLLRQATALDPAQVAATLDLARLLARSDQRAEALLRLERLIDRCEPGELPRVLAARFRLTLDLAHGWQWLRSVAGRGPVLSPEGP
ncbi:MAG: hypothetical protein QNK03_00725 [Myxococcota bacterium]|nr:hypothetical protein [Myxococcota bacterium]